MWSLVAILSLLFGHILWIWKLTSTKKYVKELEADVALFNVREKIISGALKEKTQKLAKCHEKLISISPATAFDDLMHKDTSLK
jgi:hypothetical protein